MTIKLIAPCGMNCRLCRAYIRENKPCPGCRDTSKHKPKIRTWCRIKLCPDRRSGAKYCFACTKYPCDRLDHIDKRYRTKYGMSMIENLEQIRTSGIRRFVKQEQVKWACGKCGAVICVHEERCVSCGGKRYSTPKKKPGNREDAKDARTPEEHKYGHRTDCQ